MPVSAGKMVRVCRVTVWLAVSFVTGNKYIIVKDLDMRGLVYRFYLFTSISVGNTVIMLILLQAYLTIYRYA